MKVRTKTAQSELKTFNVEFAHGTSGKFYEPGVAMIQEVRKGLKETLHVAAMRYVDPMVKPPMSAVRFNTRFFYVPMIDICPYYNELDARTPYAYRWGQEVAHMSSSIPTYVPKIDTEIIKTAFFGNIKAHADAFNFPSWDVPNSDLLELVHTGYEETAAYDIRIKVTNLPLPDKELKNNIEENNVNRDQQTYAYFRYTREGRIYYKILRQLGYDFAVTADDYIGGSKGMFVCGQGDMFSALPLLAFLKIYINYFYSSQYINNTQNFKQLNALLHCDAEYELSESDLHLIMDCAEYMCYENDYFTSSFVNPTNGNNFIANNESIAINDITMPNDESVVVTDQNNNSTPILTSSESNIGISANGINLLKRLTNYLRRHQVAGGRMVDRILAEYGVSIENSYSRRSSYIDSITSVMNITPVLNTTSEQLGDFAGFGTTSNDMKNNAITINVPEQDGYIIAIDTIVPEIFYSQGYNRQNRHLTKWDFVAGTDFDAVGVQSIELGELLMSKEGLNYVGSENPSNITFGYVPRGAEYKQHVSYLTGDFNCNSINADIDSFFTDRRFDPYQHLNINNQITYSTSRKFVSTYDSNQYSRIFYLNNMETDYIKTIFRFRLEFTAPYKEIYDEYKLEDFNGNKEVNMEVGGQTMQ